ncbi:hypothetical protein EOD39_18936 [Acipenser ruthenus]|uniref:Uncharacterized protein n=1 Tax=Acipenser ruthenus TaxID=7906 RepID=A0A444U373_ACIRT|nr:hypothetical protein EOD39_18936 [Acipenser ruthenus]
MGDIDQLNKVLQASNLDLLNANNTISRLKNNILDLRNGVMWAELCTKAKFLASTMGIRAEYEEKRRCSVSTRIDENPETQLHNITEEGMKTEFYFSTLDLILWSLKPVSLRVECFCLFTIKWRLWPADIHSWIPFLLWNSGGC